MCGNFDSIGRTIARRDRTYRKNSSRSLFGRRPNRAIRYKCRSIFTKWDSIYHLRARCPEPVLLRSLFLFARLLFVRVVSRAITSPTSANPTGWHTISSGTSSTFIFGPFASRWSPPEMRDVSVIPIVNRKRVDPADFIKRLYQKKVEEGDVKSLGVARASFPRVLRRPL